MLPQLKTVTSYGTNDLPSAYGNSVMEHQPSLTTSDYLGMPTALELSSNNTETITLSCTGDKWSYKKGTDGASNRFNGTVKMAQSIAESFNPLVVSAASDNPTLTFEKVNINSDGAALTIDAGCTLTINTTGDNTSTLASSAASTIANKGILTVKGKGLFIINKSATDTHYGLENSSSFTVDDPSATSVTFHCANTAIHNAGTLGNPWMEWQFAEAPAGDAKIAFAATTRIWGTRGTLHISADAPADVMIVTPAGQILRTVKAPAGDTTLALPAGIYFVRCNDITYKVSL